MLYLAHLAKHIRNEVRTSARESHQDLEATTPSQFESLRPHMRLLAGLATLSKLRRRWSPALPRHHTDFSGTATPTISTNPRPATMSSRLPEAQATPCHRRRRHPTRWPMSGPASTFEPCAHAAPPRRLELGDRGQGRRHRRHADVPHGGHGATLEEQQRKARVGDTARWQRRRCPDRCALCCTKVLPRA